MYIVASFFVTNNPQFMLLFDRWDYWLSSSRNQGSEMQARVRGMQQGSGIEETGETEGGCTRIVGCRRE